MSAPRVRVNGYASQRELRLRFPKLRGTMVDDDEIWIMFDKRRLPVIVEMLQQAATQLQELEKTL